MRASGSTVLATSLFAQGAGPSDETNSKVGAYFKYKGKSDITVQRFFDNAYRNFSYSPNGDWTIPEEYRFIRDYVLANAYVIKPPAVFPDGAAYSYDAEEGCERQAGIRCRRKSDHGRLRIFFGFPIAICRLLLRRRLSSRWCNRLLS